MNLLRQHAREKPGLTVASGVLALLLAGGPLVAHTHPEQITPAPNAIVQSPSNVTIRFNGALEPKFSKITITDGQGQMITKDLSTLGPDGKTISISLPKLPPGSYTVNWVGVSVDSHRAQGSYKFTVKQ